MVPRFDDSRQVSVEIACVVDLSPCELDGANRSRARTRKRKKKHLIWPPQGESRNRGTQHKYVYCISTWAMARCRRARARRVKYPAHLPKSPTTGRPTSRVFPVSSIPLFDLRALLPPPRAPVHETSGHWASIVSLLHPRRHIRVAESPVLDIR
jgi:hypothetical protein